MAVFLRENAHFFDDTIQAVLKFFDNDSVLK